MTIFIVTQIFFNKNDYFFSQVSEIESLPPAAQRQGGCFAVNLGKFFRRVGKPEMNKEPSVFIAPVLISFPICKFLLQRLF
jgi:hypothetical protein